MILGVGCDIIEIARLQPSAEALARKVLSAVELTHYLTLADLSSLRFLAGRFAAKEAFSKAMGCGIGDKLSWSDITIITQGAAPHVVCDKLAAHHQCHLSISHEKNYAIAYCLITVGESLSDR